MTYARTIDCSVRLPLGVCLGCVVLLAGCRFDPKGNAATDAQVAPAVCGNGVLESGEPCDGDELGGKTCLSQGFVGGTLGCTQACELDESQCEIGGDCGNGLLDGEEECDGTELGGNTCASATSYLEGTISCTMQCTLNTIQCHTCGNSIVEVSEGCDGPLSVPTCDDEGFDGGQLVCTDCQLDTSGCTTCGDGVCDGATGETAADCPADCGWVEVTAGGEHTCAVASDGTLWCWGLNGNGQLGIGNTDDRNVPTRVPGLTGVVSASAGAAHTCAVLDDNTAWCWGLNGDGQLGIGGTTDSHVAMPVLSLVGVTQVAAGGGHTCARVGQTLWCWGLNDKGQIGDDSTTVRELPASVSTLTGLHQALSVTVGTKHSCAVRVDNTAWCWGDKGSGQLGDGDNSDQHMPVPVSTDTGLSMVTALDAGDHHTCAIAVGGAAWCWGDNGNGRLGDGTTTARPEPQPVSASTGLLQVEDITAGLHHTCAVDSAGVAWCWGDNGDGQLGDGNTTDLDVPTPVDVATGLTSALMISAGSLHSCALKTDSTVWCWGDNAVGQLGDATFTPHASPEPIP